MKKGQKVRVKADNRVGIVADSHFVNWGGKRLVQYQVKFPDTKGEAPWFPAEKLTTNLVEKVNVVFTGEKGSLNVLLELDHSTGKHMHVTVTGTPENLKEHHGYHFTFASMFLERLHNEATHD